MQVGTINVFGAVVIPADVLLSLAAAAALTVPIVRRGDGLCDPFPLVALGYLVAMVIAALASPARRTSFERITIDGYCVVLGITAYLLARAGATRVRIAWAWLVGTVLTVAAALIGIVAFYLGARDPDENFPIGDLGSLHTSSVPRVVGFLLNPNMFCSYLIVGLLLALALVGWRRPVGVLLLAGIGIALLFTWSPGLGGAGLAAALWLSASERDHWSSRTRAVVLGAGVVCAAVFVVLTVNIGPRAETWSDALDTFWNHPFVGVGPGRPVAATVYNGRFFTDAHDAWLNVAGQAGALGLLGLLAVVATVCLLAWRARPPASLPEPVRAAWFAFVGVVLYGSLALSLEQTRHVWILLGFLAAGLTATERTHSSQRNQRAAASGAATAQMSSTTSSPDGKAWPGLTTARTVSDSAAAGNALAIVSIASGNLLSG
jgi:hypothetical protein